MLFSSRITVNVRIRFSVWLVYGYAHVFTLLSVVIITISQLPPYLPTAELDIGSFLLTQSNPIHKSGIKLNS